jgi:hypothetical protein
MKTHPKKQHHAAAPADTVLYTVLSPDGLPLTPDPFTSPAQARAFIRRWCRSYRQQGYYSSVDTGRIPLDILPRCLEIVALPPA